MKIPENVKIGFKDYKVVEVENLHDTENDLYGQINYIDEVIEINKGSKDKQKFLTLLHEIIHGIDDILKIGLEEKQVDNLATGLYMTIEQNPKMFHEERKSE